MNSLDVLLVNPKNRENKPAYIPYGIVYIAAYLREKGISVGIHDRNAEVRTLEESLNQFNPRIVGFSVLSGPTITDAIAGSQATRKALPEATIVWGGVHSTLFPEQCLAEPFIDVIVRGEGEITTYELTRAIQDEKSLSTVNGISFKDGANVLHTADRSLITDLNTELPLPAWDLLDMKQYIGPKFYATRVVTYNSSRGCPFRCTFCHNPLSHNKRKWRGISAPRMVEGIELLKDRYGVNGIFFFEDAFDPDKRRVADFSELLISKRLGIKWHKMTRANYVQDKDALEKERDSGLRHVEVGVESGSNRMLEFMKKDQTKDMVRRTFNICSELRIKASALFIVGLPTETLAEFEESREFMTGLNPHIYMPSYFMPFPGSELYQYCIDHEGFKPPDKLAGIADLYAMCSSQAFYYSKAPLAETEKFVQYCITSNLRNELAQALKSFNVRALLQGMSFVTKSGMSKLIIPAVKALFSDKKPWKQKQPSDA